MTLIKILNDPVKKIDAFTFILYSLFGIYLVLVERGEGRARQIYQQ